MSLPLLVEARDLVTGKTVDIKVGHLKKCIEALEHAYRDLKWELTRETAQNFTAHCARLVIAMDNIRSADKAAADLATV